MKVGDAEQLLGGFDEFRGRVLTFDEPQVLQQLADVVSTEGDRRAEVRCCAGDEFDGCRPCVVAVDGLMDRRSGQRAQEYPLCLGGECSRRSQISAAPMSVSERMSRPKPWVNCMAVIGRTYSRNGSPPRSAMARWRGETSGSSGCGYGVSR